MTFSRMRVGLEKVSLVMPYQQQDEWTFESVLYVCKFQLVVFFMNL